MEHTRANFLKSLLLGATSVPVLIEACSKTASSSSSSESGSTSTSTSTTGTTCTATPSETAGPYPYDLSSDSAIYRTDITEGKTGVPLSLTLTVSTPTRTAPCSPMPA